CRVLTPIVTVMTLGAATPDPNNLPPMGEERPKNVAAVRRLVSLAHVWNLLQSDNRRGRFCTGSCATEAKIFRHYVLTFGGSDPYITQIGRAVRVTARLRVFEAPHYQR